MALLTAEQETRNDMQAGHRITFRVRFLACTNGQSLDNTLVEEVIHASPVERVEAWTDNLTTGKLSFALRDIPHQSHMQ